MKPARLALVVAAFALLSFAPAYANSYTFTTANQAELGSGPWGTITTTLVGDEIRVDVDLVDGYVMHSDGAFGFNVMDPDAGVTITGIVDSTYFSAGSTDVSFDGFGKFEFSINGPSTSTARTQDLDTLSFFVGRTGGFSSAGQLEELSNKDWLFAAQIASLDTSVQTGFVGAFLGDIPPPTPRDVTTPEPASMLLLGTGLVGVAGAVRRRMSRR